MLIFGATMNCIPWVYVPEILPLHARAKGVAVGISANWIWNFFVVMITPTLITQLQWKAYLIFMALNIAFVPLIWVTFPETARLTLEEMDYLFTSDAVGEKGRGKKWARMEAVMRSLHREAVWDARTRHRGSMDAAMRQVDVGGEVLGDGRVEKEGKEAAEYVERF